MVDAICKEILLRKDYTGEPLETIYFGGGTPSYINSTFIGRILNIIRENYSIVNNPEITLEANPDDLTPEKCAELFALGINRLSIGIQSFNDADLKFMNRPHNAKQAVDAVRNAQQAGFDNISIDLIYGIKSIAGDISMQAWEKNIEIALGLGVDHLSCYALTVEKRTVLADMIRKNKIQAPDEEEAVAEFEKLIELSEKAGFEQYEISNFARNNKYSRHNTSYWQRKKYLGVGPSAHSYNGVSRQWNVSNNAEYVQALKDEQIPFELEKLTLDDKFNEYVLTSLRTKWGIDLKVVTNEFGHKYLKELHKKIDMYVIVEQIQVSNDIITLTDQGKLFADAIAAELMVEKLV